MLSFWVSIQPKTFFSSPLLNCDFKISLWGVETQGNSLCHTFDDAGQNSQSLDLYKVFTWLWIIFKKKKENIYIPNNLFFQCIFFFPSYLCRCNYFVSISTFLLFLILFSWLRKKTGFFKGIRYIPGLDLFKIWSMSNSLSLSRVEKEMIISFKLDNIFLRPSQAKCI